jgi:hypothetical protein
VPRKLIRATELRIATYIALPHWCRITEQRGVVDRLVRKRDRWRRSCHPEGFEHSPITSLGDLLAFLADPEFRPSSDFHAT